MPNPLIQDGMVVWKGEDPRRDTCYYTYELGRDVMQKHAVCFPDMVETMEKLGFEIHPHWTNHGNVVGWYAVQGLRYHGPFPNVDDVELSPIVEKILAGAIHNQAFKDLLSLDKE